MVCALLLRLCIKKDNGIPMQTIKITKLKTAAPKLRGNLGAFDKGSTTKFITSQTNMPYNTPVIILFLAKKDMRETTKKKKAANAMAIIKWKRSPRKTISFPPANAALPKTPLAINFKTGTGFFPVCSIY